MHFVKKNKQSKPFALLKETETYKSLFFVGKNDSTQLIQFCWEEQEIRFMYVG